MKKKPCQNFDCILFHKKLKFNLSPESLFLVLYCFDLEAYYIPDVIWQKMCVLLIPQFLIPFYWNEIGKSTATLVSGRVFELPGVIHVIKVPSCMKALFSCKLIDHLLLLSSYKICFKAWETFSTILKWKPEGMTKNNRIAFQFYSRFDLAKSQNFDADQQEKLTRSSEICTGSR